MTLTRYKLGDLIKQHNERCANRSVNRSDISGVNRDKEFFPSRQVGSDVSNYKVVPAGYFACNLMHVGRDIVLPIAYNRSNHEVYVSPAYTVFCIKKDAPIDAIYLEMWFKSDERDRYFWMHTDSSIRDGMTYDDMCDIDIDLPSIEIQKKYVDIYKSMLDNQKCYERGLEDLKLTCEGYIEELRRNTKCEAIGQYIQESSNRNTNLAITRVQGVNSSSEFDETRANMSGVDISNYKIVNTRDFAYNPSRVNLGSIALLRDKECIVSPMYVVFSVINENELLPEYLMLWYERKEFQRSTLFYGMGSVRDIFSFDLMKEVEIPIPDIATQKSISNIYAAYIERKKLRNLMTMQIKNICPILIKGALEEANK